MKIDRAQLLSCLSVIPQRYLFALVGFLMTLVGGMMQLSLNLTLSRMVNLSNNVTCNHPEECPVPYSPDNYSELDSSSDAEIYPFDWDEEELLSVNGGFYFGYLIGQFFGGMTAVMRGGKGVLGFAFLISSLATILGPTLAKVMGPSGMRFAQTATGLGQGPTLPALMVMLAYWSPAAERARLGAIIYSGRHIGFIAGISLSKLIFTYTSWDIVYYVFGVIGLIQVAVWYLLCYSTPNTHPFISEKEKTFLNDNITVLIRSAKYKMEPLPWSALLRSVPFWAICAGALGNKLAYRTVIIQVPAFMEDVQNYDVNTSSIIPLVPLFLISISTVFFGFLCDFGIKLNVHSISKARKMYTIIAALVPVICILIATYSGNKAIIAIFCINISMVALGAYYSGMMVAPIDIAPNYCGVVFAIVDSMGNNLIHLLLPLFVKNVIDGTLAQWRIFFWVCIIVICIATIVSVKFIIVKQLWWDDVRKFGYPVEWKHGLFPAEGVIDLKNLQEGDKNEVQSSP